MPSIQPLPVLPAILSNKVCKRVVNSIAPPSRKTKVSLPFLSNPPPGTYSKMNESLAQAPDTFVHHPFYRYDCALNVIRPEPWLFQLPVLELKDRDVQSLQGIGWCAGNKDNLRKANA